MAYRLRAEASADRGLIISGNREGLQRLGEVCLSFSQLSEDDIRTGRVCSHYNFESSMYNLDAGSQPFEILFDPKLL
jgi:hypothetical protein